MTSPLRSHAVMSTLTLLLLLLLTLMTSLASAMDPRAAASEQQRIVYTLQEEGRPRTVLGNVVHEAQRKRLLPANDTMGPVTSVRIMSNGNYRESFRITPDGQLETERSVDREKHCAGMADCLVELDVAVNALEPHFVKVYVRVTDVNDHSPRFFSENLAFPLPESTRAGHALPIGAARDDDGPALGVQRYELVPVTPAAAGRFQLQTRNGSDGSVELRLAVAQELDREKEDYFRLKIVAYDGGSPARSGSVNIDLTVTDVNDNSPKFDKSLYEVEVPESRVVNNSTLLRVRATDPDGGANGQITYRLVEKGGSGTEVFAIGAQSGEIRLLRPLDYEAVKTYHLTVVAQDQGADSVQAHCKVKIVVSDVNDNAPVINVNPQQDGGVLHVEEHSEPNSFVAHVSVADRDSGNNGRTSCSLRPVGSFALERLYDTEYKIVSVAMLDREQQETYELTIECSDQGEPEKVTRVPIVVKVTDVNDHSPVFSEPTYNVRVRENNRLNDYVVRVSASDVDHGRNAEIAYEIVTSAGSNSFAIDPRSGIITTREVFDREKIDAYTLLVRARDRGDESRTSTATVVVQILDEDDRKPVFSKSAFEFSVPENVEARFRVGQLTAEDADLPPNDRFFFYFDAPPADYADVFAVNHAEGTITTKRPLNREERETYVLTAVVKSNAVSHMTDTAIVTITVTDVNDNDPYFMYPSDANETLYVSSLVPRRHVVCKVQATDADAGDNGRLSFKVSPRSFRDDFIVDPMSGEVSVSGDLSRIAYDEFRLEIIAYDHGTPRRQTQATLNVIVNRDIPFLASHSAVSEARQYVFSPFQLIVVACIVLALLIFLIVVISMVVGLRRRRLGRHGNVRRQTKGIMAAAAIAEGAALTPDGHVTVPQYCDLNDYGSNPHLEHDVHEASVTPPSTGHGDHETDSGIECQGGGDSDTYARIQSGQGTMRHNYSTGSLKRQQRAMAATEMLTTSAGRCQLQQQQQQPLSPSHQQQQQQPPYWNHQPSSPASFVDWMQAENYNVQQSGHNYRVAEGGTSGGGAGGVGVAQNKKSVRFEPPVFRYDADGLKRLPLPAPATWGEQDEDGLLTVIDSLPPPPPPLSAASAAAYSRQLSAGAGGGQQQQQLPSQQTFVVAGGAGSSSTLQLSMSPGHRVAPPATAVAGRNPPAYATLPSANQRSQHTFT